MVIHRTVAPTATVSPPASGDLLRWAAQYDSLHIDLGTGDGTFALDLARQQPASGVVGLDIMLDHLRGSRRRHPSNVRFERLDALEWLPWAIPAADSVTINFPYASLLNGLVKGNNQLVAVLEALLGPGSRLEIRVNQTAFVATGLDQELAPQMIVETLRKLDGLRTRFRELSQAELRSFPSSWAKRLGYGREAPAFIIEAIRTG